MVETPGRITLWGLEVFVATAEEQSISAAARRLGASASAVSQQITNLEQAVGAALMTRSARPVTLTPAGETLRGHAQAILDEADAARTALAGADMSGLARLRLGMIEDFDADVTPRLLAGMGESLRDCRFLLETGASHRLFDLLEARTLDMIVTADIGAAADWMEVHPLMAEPFVAVLPRDFGAPDPAALRELPMIQYTARHHMGRQIGAHLARQNLRPAHRYELDSYHAILAMVAEGLGWSILTPLGVLRARRFLDAVALHPLPVAPLTRTISLYAREGVFREMPVQVADRLRGLIAAHVVTPALARMPWAAAELRLL